MLMKVTALRVRGQNRQRVDVYLDGERAFSLTASEARDLHLGQDLSPEEVARWYERETQEKAQEAALRYLGYRPRSTEEVRRYLEKRGFPMDVQETTLTRLREGGFLDDRTFARFWVEEREQFRPRGRHALRYELRQKGVDAELVEEALASVDEEAGAYEAARPQAVRFIRQGLGAQGFFRKLGQFLLRRGYGYEVAHRVVSRLWHELREDHPTEGKEEAS
jgi:regulatory protein